MKVNFVGGVERVTGSCSWLKKGNVEFLVDCGMIQGEVHDHFENNKKFPFNPKNIKFMFLTHAHLDHCGLIPRLYKEGFNGTVFSTRATGRLAKEVLIDAAKIGAPYSIEDVNNIHFSFFDDRENFKWGRMIPVDNNIFAAFYRTSHILGSASISISWGNNIDKKNILFTGDIGNNTRENSFQPLLKPRQGPDKRTSFVVCESTYGNRIRNKNEEKLEYRTKFLKNIIENTIFEKQGNLIIPTFSMQRTQEILFDLYYLLQKTNFSDKKMRLRTYLKYEKNILKSFVSQKVLDDFLNDQNIPLTAEEKQKIYNAHLPYVIRLSKNKYNEIITNNFPNYNLNEYSEKFEKNKKKNSKYSSREYHYDIRIDRIKDQNIREEILNYLVNKNMKNNIRFAFHEEMVEKVILEKLNIKIEKFFPKELNIICDSPLAAKISSIYGEELTKSYHNGNEIKKLYMNNNIKDWLNIEAEKTDSVIKELFSQNIKIENANITTVSTKSKLNLSLPSIIITSSGMCDAGPILKHLNNFLQNSNNTILLNGFQSKNSNGYILSELENYTEYKKNTTSIKLEKDQEIICKNIQAEIIKINGYSGHADQESLLQYLCVEDENFKFVPPNIFLNHGNDESREIFKDKILEHSKKLENKYNSEYPYKTKVIIPRKKDGWYNLDKKCWETENEINENEFSNETLNTVEINNLNNQIAELTKIIEKLTKKCDFFRNITENLPL